MAGTPTLKIFYGPPGTGKTYEAAREAVRIIDGKVDPTIAAERHRELVRAGRIFWVTFHPSYSYEDFVEGYRPVLEGGGMQYRVVDGPFKIACDACARAVSPFLEIHIGDEIGKYIVTHKDVGGVVLENPDNFRRDAVTQKQIQYVDFWTLEYLRSKGVTPADLSPSGQENSDRKDLAKDTNLLTTFLTNAARHRAVWERVEEIRREAAKRPVVLVIDEINRADLSRVFGELMTLLEVDKREGGAEETRVILPYSGETFAVPECLSVIGTMNTADRSLAVVDLALRRRFEFEEVSPAPDRCAGYGEVRLGEVLREWNRRIALLRSRDHRIGHAELMRPRLDSVRNRLKWPDTKDGELRAVARTVREKILPLLLEYFPDDWRRADFVLGRGRLLQPEDLGDLAEEAQEYLDIEVSDDSSFVIPDWWDPNDEKWDADRFRTALLSGVGVELTSPVEPPRDVAPMEVGAEPESESLAGSGGT